MQISSSITGLFETIEVRPEGGKVNLTPLRKLRRRFFANFQKRVQERKSGSIAATTREVIVDYRNQVVGIPDLLYQFIAVTFKIVQVEPHGGPQ